MTFGLAPATRARANNPVNALARREQEATLDIATAEIQAWTTQEITKAWTDAATDAGFFAASREIETADALKARAGDSPVDQEIAGRYIALINQTNVRTFTRAFR